MNVSSNFLKKSVDDMDKQPKIPTFPLVPKLLAQKLQEIIAAGGERSSLAYSVLTRLCAMYAPGALVHDGTPTGGQYGIVLNEQLRLMEKLFPGGVGLPELTDDES
jgi:hypothetical protein